jgi:hypothetical protein
VRIVGAAFTVKQPEHDAVPPSVLVTVTFPAPVVAVDAIVMLAVSWVLLTKVVEFTVIPPAENVAAAPLENPVPEIVMFWLAAPWPREDGLVEETVGAETTVKQLAHEPIPASGLVTVTALLPVVAFDAIEMVAVSWVLLTNVVEFTVIPLPKVAVAPLTKFEPFTVMLWLLAPCALEDGLVELTFGPGFTVKQFVHEPLPASPFVTVRSPMPTEALFEIVRLTVSWVPLTNVVEFTVMPFPVKEAESGGPPTNPEPLTVMLWPVDPWPRLEGLMDEIVGAAFTVKQLEHDPSPASGSVTVTLLVPVVALAVIEIIAVSDVDETNDVELTVIPVPENVAVAPLTNPVPVIVML